MGFKLNKIIYLNNSTTKILWFWKASGITEKRYLKCSDTVSNLVLSKLSL